MAQNKRKRQTKHRGTQAGTIESRGRTSRPRSRAEARQQALQRRQGGRTSRANVAPTWNSAIKRAGIAAVVLLALMLVLAKETSTVGAIAVAIVAFIIYIPLGYWFDTFIWNMRQRQVAKRERQGDDE